MPERSERCLVECWREVDLWAGRLTGTACPTATPPRAMPRAANLRPVVAQTSATTPRALSRSPRSDAKRAPYSARDEADPPPDQEMRPYSMTSTRSARTRTPSTPRVTIRTVGRCLPPAGTEAVRACEAASARQGRRTVRRLEAGRTARPYSGPDSCQAATIRMRSPAPCAWIGGVFPMVTRSSAPARNASRTAGPPRKFIGNFFRKPCPCFRPERTPTSRMRIPYISDQSQPLATRRIDEIRIECREQNPFRLCQLEIVRLIDRQPVPPSQREDRRLVRSAVDGHPQPSQPAKKTRYIGLQVSRPRAH